MPQTDADTNFARVAVLRRETADLADTLDDEQLALPSLCGQWDVRTVVAHLSVLPTVSKLRFGVVALRSRGDLDRTIDTLSRDLARAPIADLADALREHAASRATPPMMDSRAPLADLVAHSADIRIPLGLPFAPEPGDASVALDFISSAPLGFMPRRRLAGLRLVATDLGEAHGSGEELRGTAADLIVSILGRRVALDRLTGPGKDVLLARL